jgi:hypothetical protein
VADELAKMDPEELKKLSADPVEEASPTEVVDKFLAQTLPSTTKPKKEIKIKAKKVEKEKSSEEFAKRANELEQEHIDDIKSALTPTIISGGFSVSKVIESIAQKENKPTEDVAQVHLKE